MSPLKCSVRCQMQVSGNNISYKQRLAALLTTSTYLLGGISVEKSSTSVSARSTAFMPLVQRRLSQKIQLTCVTHLFLKLALDVDIVVLLKWTNSLALSVLRPQMQQKQKE